MRILIFLTGLALFTAPALGAEITLNGPTGTSVTVNGAIFSVYGAGSSGTGVIDPFLRLHDTGNTDGVQSGYNSGLPRNNFPNGFPDQDQVKGNFTYNITVGGVGTMDIAGTPYRIFLLDLNETNGQGQNQIALTELQIYADPEANLVGDVSTMFDQLIFDLDGNADNTVGLWDQFSGSGDYDVMISIPDALFNGINPLHYLYLYAQFSPAGLNRNTSFNGPDGGFEEFAALQFDGPGPGPTPIPEPATLVIWSLLLAGAGATSAYRARSARSA